MPRHKHTCAICGTPLKEEDKITCAVCRGDKEPPEEVFNTPWYETLGTDDEPEAEDFSELE